MAFKTATVNSSRVAATLTDFPSYIDWSRAGILTLAEAQSARVYADSGKVVEWAREVVSANEGHTLVPSMTTSTAVYVDYDGIRADYAVTDTYGRNAVWSDYSGVFHLDDLTDSTGNGNDLTNISGVSFGAGKLGYGANFNGSGYLIKAGYTGFDNTLDVTVSSWIKRPSTTGTYYFWNPSGTANDVAWDNVIVTSTNNVLLRRTRRGVASDTLTFTNPLTADVFAYSSIKYNSSTGLFTGRINLSTQSATFSGNGNFNISDDFVIGRSHALTAPAISGSSVDEFRIKNGLLTNDWETTEYNNQNDEADFWGTWTDAGGGPTPANVTARRLIFFGL